MITSSVGTNEGTAKFMGTYQISEDAITKQIQRAVLNDSTGAELGSVTNPLAVKGPLASGVTAGPTAFRMAGVYKGSSATRADGQQSDLTTNINEALLVSLFDYIEGEDSTNHVMKVEGQFLSSRKTADGQVKGSPGFIHTVSIAPIVAAPTAGMVTIYDSLTETGTIIYSEWVFATAPGHTILLNRICDVGIFVGYDATLANVQTTVTYR